MRTAKDPEKRKTELLDAAETLFGEKGYDHTSVNDIVKRVGVAQGTFYYHFASKDDILEELTDRFVQRIHALVSETIRRPDLDSVHKIEAFAEGILSISKQEAYLLEYVHREKNAIVHQKLGMKALNVFTPVLEQLLEEGNREKMFSVIHTHAAAQLIVITIEYLQEAVACASGEEDAESAKAAVSDCIARLLGIQDDTLRIQ